MIQAMTGLSAADARTVVAAGAAWLDQIRPGWAHMVNLGRLNLRSAYHCVLGQCYEDAAAGTSMDGYRFALNMWGENSVWARLHGFTLYLTLNYNLDRESWAMLDCAWQEAILARRQPAPTETAPASVVRTVERQPVLA